MFTWADMFDRHGWPELAAPAEPKPEDRASPAGKERRKRSPSRPSKKPKNDRRRSVERPKRRRSASDLQTRFLETRGH